MNASLTAEEETITRDIFSRIACVRAIDRYEAYQVLDNAWRIISPDLEMLQTEGESALTAVDPNMVTKQKDGKDVEVQDGWVGHILPFELVQRILLQDDLAVLGAKEEELSSLSAVYDEILESLSEDERDSSITADGNASFASKDVREKVEEILEDIETEEIAALTQYLTIAKKEDKIAYVAECMVIGWAAMEPRAHGPFSKTVVNGHIAALKKQHQFPADSFEDKMLRVLSTMERETQLKREIKAMRAELHEKTRTTILGLDHETALIVLEAKWITPILDGIGALPKAFISDLIDGLDHLSEKYRVTFAEVGDEISMIEKVVSGSVAQLRGNEFNMEGFIELQKLLGGTDVG
jgi:type I restriction enzyme M protein